MTFTFPRRPQSTAKKNNTSDGWSFYKSIISQVFLLLNITQQTLSFSSQEVDDNYRQAGTLAEIENDSGFS